MKNLYQIKDGEMIAEIIGTDAKQGLVTGYFSKFNNVDSDGDIMKPGAFTKTIAEQGPGSTQPRIKHLLNHEVDQPLGKLLSLKEDSYGLLYESQIGSHSLGEDFIKMIESGLITEHSIGFQIIKRNQIQSWEDYSKNPSAGLFEITEVKLFEGSSLTGWGANSLTPLVGMKSEFKAEKLIAKMKAIEKFCRNSTATDETIEALLLQSKQLAQFIIDMQKSTEPAPPIQPQKEIVDTLRAFTNTLKTPSN